MLIAGGGGGSTSSESWWPGLDLPADRQEMDPDALRELADELDGVLRDLRSSSAGSLNDVQDKGSRATSGGAFGNWDLGQQMRDGYVDAHTKIINCYNELVVELEAAIYQLRNDAGLTEATDQASAIQGDVPPTGYTGAPAGDVAMQPGMNV